VLRGAFLKHVLHDRDDGAFERLRSWRQSHTIDALCTQNIDAIEFGQVFRRERLRWAKDHVPGVVNHNRRRFRGLVPENALGGTPKTTLFLYQKNAAYTLVSSPGFGNWLTGDAVVSTNIDSAQG
jgi:hypothetical protein